MNQCVKQIVEESSALSLFADFTTDLISPLNKETIIFCVFGEVSSKTTRIFSARNTESITACEESLRFKL